MGNFASKENKEFEINMIRNSINNGNFAMLEMKIHKKYLDIREKSLKSNEKMVLNELDICYETKKFLKWYNLLCPSKLSVIKTDSESTSISYKNHNLIEKNLRHLYSLNQYKWKSKILKGPPNEFRWISWAVCLQIPEKRDSDFFSKCLLDSIDPKIETQIKLDIPRTLHENITNYENILFDLLKSYALLDEEVSYCQGMSFIFSFLLTISDFNQSETFYMITSLLNLNFNLDISLRGLFTKDFPLLSLLIFQFDKIYSKRLPRIKEHFRILEFSDHLWISKWFQTIFTNCLPFHMVVRIWDCIISQGIYFIFNISLSLLIYLEKNILSFNELYDLSKFFKNLKIHTTYIKDNENIDYLDIEQIIQEAYMITISEEQLNHSKKEFEILNKIDLSILKGKNSDELLMYYSCFEKEVSDGYNQN